jgi:hypothetical protein
MFNLNRVSFQNHTNEGFGWIHRQSHLCWVSRRYHLCIIRRAGAIDTFLDSKDQCNASGDVNENEFIDFWDLLLHPAESVALGGNGRSQYGNLFRVAFSVIQDKLFAID